MDDGTVGSESADLHIEDVDEVLTLLRRAGMKLKFSKCTFGTTTIELLGHKVTPEGVLPSNGHVEAIRNLQEPRTGTELLRFMGLMNYFAEFIPNFAHRAKPLHDLLKGSGFNKKKRHRKQVLHIPGWEQKWGAEQSSAWQDLKNELSSPCKLTAPDNTKVKRVVTDASDYGLGGVLLQLDDNGKWKPVSFTARKLKGAELNHTVSEKECLAVVHALRKWRHYLQACGGPQFVAVTDHQALKWLMSLKEPKGRLARWMMDIQDYDFEVEHALGHTVAVADTLSRDAVERNTCPLCAELVAAIGESSGSLPTVLQFKQAQEEEFGLVERYCQDNEDFIVDEDGLLCKMDGSGVRIVVPMELVPQVLSCVHGSLACGHYGIARTAHRIRLRFWCNGWKKDVRQRVQSCLNCAVENLGRPKRHGKMKTWHPLRRFQVVAMDVTDISPPSLRGYEKVLVIGFLFTRFIWAVPLKNERAATIAEAILNEWILRFGPPERLLSDRARNFMSELLTSLCERVGVRKIFTSPYHPPTDGFVERFNRTLAKDIRAFIGSNLEDWDLHIAMACFRYNTSRNDAIGMTPYRAVFGIDAFDFDAELGRRMMIDQEVEMSTALQKRLADVHRSLLTKSLGSRMNAARQYNKLVEEVEFKVDDRVMVYNPRYDVQKGRKLTTPWMGPYRVEEVLTSISYLVRAEVGREVARVHVNRLRKFDDTLVETGNTLDGVFPDTRRLIQRIVDDKKARGQRLFKVRHAFRNGWEWILESELPALIMAYDSVKAKEASQ